LGVAEDVEFVGYLADPISRLIEFDLFALSSDTEQLPIAMLEAMACGIPVVATRVGDVGSIMAFMPSTMLSAPNDEAFTEAILLTLADKTRWQTYADIGLKEINEKYSLIKMKQQWLSIYDNR